jgi:hypothetical protein
MAPERRESLACSQMVMNCRRVMVESLIFSGRGTLGRRLWAVFSMESGWSPCWAVLAVWAGASVDPLLGVGLNLYTRPPKGFPKRSLPGSPFGGPMAWPFARVAAARSLVIVVNNIFLADPLLVCVRPSCEVGLALVVVWED